MNVTYKDIEDDKKKQFLVRKKVKNLFLKKQHQYMFYTETKMTLNKKKISKYSLILEMIGTIDKKNG